MPRIVILVVILLAGCAGQFSQAGMDPVDNNRELLQGNIASTEFTALVEYGQIRIAEVIGGYAFMEHDCRVIRVFRGKPETRVVFYHQVDLEFAEKIKKHKSGKRYIVSLDQDPDNGKYMMGDNGYEFPGTEDNIRLAEAWVKEKNARHRERAR